MQKQLVAVPFAGGIDTKTEEKHVLPTKLLALQNGIFQNTGAINKRWGYTALSTAILGNSGNITSAFALQAFGNELLEFDGQSAYSYSTSNAAWVNRGSVVSVIQSNQDVIRNSSQQLSPDMAVMGGVEVYAWEDSRGGIRYSVLDAASESYLVVDQPLYTNGVATDARPKCLPFPAAGVIVVLFATAAGEIALVTINPANPTAVIVTKQPIVSGLPTPVYYDACISGTQLALIYYTASNVVAAAFNSSFQSQWATNLLGQASIPTGCLAIAGDGSANVWCAYANSGAGSTQANCSVLSSLGAFLNVATTNVLAGPTPATTALQSIGMTVVDAELGPFSFVAPDPGIILPVATVAIETIGSKTYNNVTAIIKMRLLHAQFLLVARSGVVRSVGVASKPFAYNGFTYLNVAFQSQLQATYFTLVMAPYNPFNPTSLNLSICGKVNPSLCGGLVANSDYLLPECQSLQPGIFKYANLVKGQANSEAGGIFSLLGVNATRLDFIDSNHFLSSAINGGLYTVGGIMQSYDGAQYVEHGFHVYPEPITLTVGGGGSLGTGLYNYAATYEWTDNNGNVQISTPSPVVSASTAAGNSISISVPTLRLTSKTRVRIVIYRTTANGVLLYRVTSAALPTYSDPTVDSVIFVDTLSDANIQSNGLLYTQPLATGANPVLPNSAPLSCSLITSYANRLVANVSDNATQLQYTQPVIPGVPAQFASALTINVDAIGGPITGLARLDDKLVIFKQYSIFVMIFQGPDPTGNNSDITEPVGIPSGGVGCGNQNSIVLTPLGLMFATPAGTIYLLDRSLNVTFKGAPAQAFKSLTITSATLIPDQWVVFTTTTGTAIVYDYYYDQWGTFTNHAAVDGELYVGQNGAFVFAATNGQVYLQTPSAFTDAGAPIQLSLTTAWMNPGVLQGYQRIYHAFLLGTYRGTHNLQVSVGFNYNPVFTAMTLIPVDSTIGISTFGAGASFGSDASFGGTTSDVDQYVYQFRLDILRKCEAFRLQIQDLQTSPGNEGLSLASLALLVGVKSGGHKLPALKQFGAV
jgi:hypothetical protein